MGDSLLIVLANPLRSQRGLHPRCLSGQFSHGNHWIAQGSQYVRLSSLESAITHTRSCIVDWAGRALHPDLPALIIIRNHAEHMRRRKAWNRAFNTSSLKGYEPVIEKRARQLVDALSARKNQVVDLAEWVSFFTYVAFRFNSAILNQHVVWHLRFDFMGDMA